MRFLVNRELQKHLQQGGSERQQTQIGGEIVRRGQNPCEENIAFFAVRADAI